MNTPPARDWPNLSPRIISRSVSLDVHDNLQMHILEAFPLNTDPADTYPLILLLHGFPELAYSWRKVLVPLADAHSGYHVVAPDLRGFGRSVPKADAEGSPRKVEYHDPLGPFHILAIAEDVRSLVQALGYTSVAMLVGHDFGSPLAGYCVLAHPNVYKSVVFMSAPFAGIDPPAVQASADKPSTSLVNDIASALAALDPPRKHYTAYFSTPGANSDILEGGEDDLRQFIAGYFYMKGGRWPGNLTHALSSASAQSMPSIQNLANDLAILPEYYVMPLHESMKDVITRNTREYSTSRPHLEEDEDAIAVYASEFNRTGFQGGLNYYRCALSPPPADRVEELSQLAGKRLRRANEKRTRYGNGSRQKM
ncbi:Alpha/Beta hydrolase protein [Hygrophoropsis aurantiaca]|uniref:Alpha/Beta hydrolase protein n=1 Tax=Hygrophoropsis aurantiaca TaxID=72124 RepID=A0ACB8AIX4_9AGAM|nr:Alpha/Beta hydrolase protein [Hygrophoropsis aurantiaca]